MTNLIDERGLPADLPCERFVLGSILLDGEKFTGVAGAIDREDFAIEKHRRIWACMEELERDGEPIDRVTVITMLNRRGWLESVDGVTYMVSLDEGIPQIAHVDAMVRTIRDKSLLRKIAVSAQNLMNRAIMAEDASAEILAGAEKVLAALQVGDTKLSNWQNVGEVIAGYPGGLGGIVTPNRSGNGIKLPWVRMNDLIPGGMQPGELVLLSGRPSHGKTSAALQMCVEAARTGRGVGYFSLEMVKPGLIRRLLGQMARVDTQKMVGGFLSPAERERVRIAAAELASLPIYIDDKRNRSASSLRRALKQLKAKHPIDFVIVDHLHLVTGDRGEDPRARYSRIADDFQSQAHEQNVVYMALCQLGRDCEKEGRPPCPADLKETGKLEENADICLFTHRPEMYGKNRLREDLHGHAELICGKNRSGQVGTQQLIFIASMQRFENRDEDCNFPETQEKLAL